MSLTSLVVPSFGVVLALVLVFGPYSQELPFVVLHLHLGHAHLMIFWVVLVDTLVSVIFFLLSCTCLDQLDE